jgi:hypothetical protein
VGINSFWRQNDGSEGLAKRGRSVGLHDRFTSEGRTGGPPCEVTPRRPRRGDGAAARSASRDPDLSKPNGHAYQEARLESENGQGQETLGRVIEMPGLSKTVVAEMNRCRHGHGSRHPACNNGNGSRIIHSE